MHFGKEDCNDTDYYVNGYRGKRSRVVLSSDTKLSYQSIQAYSVASRTLAMINNTSVYKS